MPRYEAIILDADGTLLDNHSKLRDSIRRSLHGVMARGIKVMIATGRTARTSREILLELDTELPAIVFNGAGLYCPREDRLLESQMVDDALIAQVIARAHDLRVFWFASRADEVVMGEPVTSEQRELTRRQPRVRVYRNGEPAPESVLRISLASDVHETPAQLLELFKDLCALGLTRNRAFPLSEIPAFRTSKTQIVEFEPLGGGKHEALHYLKREFGIPPERIVAVGDAPNDLSMLEAAGLGVAMGNAGDEVKEAADRVIGHNESSALVDLVRELFPE